MTLHSQDPADAVAYSTLASGVHRMMEKSFMHDLAKDFSLHEMQCSDGSHAVLAHPALIHGLQELRNHANAPVTIESGYRTAAHNEAIGGATRSRHLYGMAADVTVGGMTPAEVQAWAEQMQFGGIGYYPTFTHLDVQGKGRRWGPAL